MISTVVTVALVTAGTVLAGGVASAATPVSQSTGQFLSGVALTQDLGNLAGLAPATATNTGAPAVVTTNKAIDATVLNSANVSLGTVNLLGSNGILQLGAVNQYASASADGSSKASSGAVDQNGAVQIGPTGAGTPAANATLDLAPLLTGASLTTVLSAGKVTVGALAGTAAESAAAVKTGSYKIGSLGIDLTSPLVSNITATLKTALAPADTLLAAVSALGIPGLVVVNGVPDLNTLITNLGTATSADGSLTVNLNTGVVHLDVAKILTAAGLDINNLPPNTQLLPYITAALTSQLAPTISNVLTGPTGLLHTITTAVNAITITTFVGVPPFPGPPVPLPPATITPIITAVTTPLQASVANLGSTVITPLATGLSTLVSLEANVQPTLPTANRFSVTALQIGVLPTSETAVVDLATASVGPNGGQLPAPTTLSLNPATGPVSGGTQVVITGANFVPTATSVTIGGIVIPAANVTVNTAGTTATFTTPPHAAGGVPVTVTTPSGPSNPALTFTYTPPTTLSLTPGGGPLSGGTLVTITGSGFTPTSTVLIGSIPVPATSVSLDGTTLTFSTPPRAVPGPVDVQVISSGVATTPPLTYVYGPALALSLTPTEGPAAGGTTVVVTGVGFVPGGTSVLIGGNTVPAASVTVDPTGTTATFTTPAHPAGPVDVTVQTAGGTSTPALGFTYDPLAAVSLSPDHGPSTGNTAVTITGSGFVPGQTSITIGGITIPPGLVTVDPTGTTAVFLTPPHGDGGVQVTVTTPAGTTGPLGYTYGTAAAPVTSCVLTGINPATGLNAATVSVLTNTGINSGLVPSTFSVQVGGVTAGSEPVTPAVTGTVAASISVPVVNGTTAVDYRIAPQQAGLYNPVTGGPIPCTTITPGQRVAGIYFPLTPARLLDTRHGLGATQTLAPGATITLKVLGKGGVPATNVATVVLNMTVTQPVTAGYLTLYPGTSPRPNTSSINFGPKQTVANLVAAPVGSDGTVKIYNGSTGGTEAIADVAGYFSAGDTVAPGSYVPVTPARLLDTSARIGVPTNTFVPSGASVKLRVTGIGGVPATNVSAVSLNVTAAQPTTAGFITVYPSTSAKPFVSSLNFVKGATDANLVIAPVGTDGTVTLYNGSKGTVRLVADVSGFFRGGVSVLNGEYVAISPSRILDTRSGVNVAGKVGAGASIAPTMVGRNGIPSSGVSAVVFNLTVTSTTGPGFITAYPNNLPLASNLNFVAKQDQPNAVISPVGSGGKIRLYNGSQHPVDLVSDVFGYFIKR